MILENLIVSNLPILICCNYPESFYSQIKVALAPVGSIKNHLDEQQLQDVVSEIVVLALRNTLVNLNLSVYPTCPRLIRQTATYGPILPVHYDSMVSQLIYTHILTILIANSY